MSCMDTGGKSPRFRTRAQNLAITKESAPRSSKKWLSTDTRSMRRTSASSSAKTASTPVGAEPCLSSVTNGDLGIVVTSMGRARPHRAVS